MCILFAVMHSTKVCRLSSSDVNLLVKNVVKKSAFLPVELVKYGKKII